MIDRLAEMKAMVLDVSKRIKGDEFFIGLIQQLETSMNLYVMIMKQEKMKLKETI